LSRKSKETFPWILKHPSGKAWFDTLHSDRTKEIYLSRLKQYCDAVSKNPDELIELKIGGLRNSLDNESSFVSSPTYNI